MSSSFRLWEARPTVMWRHSRPLAKPCYERPTLPFSGIAMNPDGLAECSCSTLRASPNTALGRSWSQITECLYLLLANVLSSTIVAAIDPTLARGSVQTPVVEAAGRKSL